VIACDGAVADEPDTDRLGLFVVSRLARRHGVRVGLQTSPYGGTTAVVFIPGAILTETSEGGREDTGALVSYTAYLCDDGVAAGSGNFFNVVIPSEGFTVSGTVTSGDILKR